MKRIHILTFCLFLTVTGTSLVALTTGCAQRAAPVAVELPQQRSPLPPDPTVTWGVLDNGMAYAVVPNEEPRERVSLRLLVMSGSLLESDAQRGLAHYLEHMAFNGSTNFPPGTLVEQLQRLGLGFGSDTNAHTSFDETVYKLDLPDAKPTTLDLGLTVMADYAGGLLILPDQVARERGVILAEMRDRDTPDYRRWQALAATRYAGTTVPDRAPIGIAETVTNATPELLRAYYDTWYRPERMVLAVAGAVEPGVAIEHIRSHFAPLKARLPAQPEPPRGQVIAAPLAITCRRDPQADGEQVQVVHTVADPAPIDTVASRRRDLARDLAVAVINRRFQDLVATAPDGPLIKVDIDNGRWLDLWHADLTARVRSGQSLAAVPIIEQEVRQFLHFGPTVTEMDAVRADTLAHLDEAVAKGATRRNADRATALIEAVKERLVAMSPSQERDLLAPLVKTITADEVRTAYDEDARRSGGRLVVMVSGPDDLGKDAEARISRAWTDSTAVAVHAPFSKAVGVWSYGREWTPGEGVAPAARDVTGEGERAAGVVRYQVGTVPVLVKRTDFKPDEVLVRMRLAMPPGPRQAGLAEFAGAAFLAGGLKNHSVQDLRDIFAGSTVQLSGPLIGDDGIVFGATCRPQELESAFQRLVAYLLEPGWRPDAEAATKTTWLDQLATLDSDLDQRVERAFTAQVTGNAPERRAATREEAAAMDFTQLRTWLAPLLKNAPLAVSVVGDVQPDVVRDLAARYCALPVRPSLTVADNPAAAVRIEPAPWVPTRIDLAVPGTVPRALLMIGWPTDDFYDVRRTRRLGLLAQAFTEKLRQRVRQQLGDAYSPMAFHQASEAYRGFGVLAAVVGVSPDKTEEARAAILAIAADLAEHGVDDALLAQVKPPVVTSIATQRRRNAYWIDRVLLRAAEQPFRLDWSATMEPDYLAITSAELTDLAKRYLDNTKTVQVVGVCRGK